MSIQRIFSLPEASALLPKINKMLMTANQELTDKAETLANAYIAYERCEQEMNKIKPDNGFADLRECRLNFQTAIESLSQAKQDYMQAVNFWIDEIADTGVILRDIKSGLLDFPARSGNFDYYLCWRLGENEIGYWHMMNDGFPGRRPLTVLNEYV